VEKQLAQASQHCATYRYHGQQLARQQLTHLLYPDQSLDQAGLARLTASQRNLVLRLWFVRQQQPPPGPHDLYYLWQQIQAGGQWQRHGWQVCCFQQRLYLINQQPISRLTNRQRQWPMICNQPVNIAGIGQLQLVASPGGLQLDSQQPLTIRLRQGGERFQPLGRQHSQLLKKLLQEKSCPPWERQRLPLLYAGDQLVAVPYVGLAFGHTVASHRMGWRLLWRRQSA